MDNKITFKSDEEKEKALEDAKTLVAEATAALEKAQKTLEDTEEAEVVEE